MSKYTTTATQWSSAEQSGSSTGASAAEATQQQKQQKKRTAAAAAAATATATGPRVYTAKTAKVRCVTYKLRSGRTAVLQQGTTDMSTTTSFPRKQRQDRLGTRTTLAPAPRSHPHPPRTCTSKDEYYGSSIGPAAFVCFYYCKLRVRCCWS